MLTSYYVRNFKAFESAEIELRPLSLLLGPNSTGKTSLAELLLMMQQTAQVGGGSGFKGPLRINGGIVSLGAIENLFHKTNTKEPFVLGFRFISKSLKTSQKNDMERFADTIFKYFRDCGYYLSITDEKGKPSYKKQFTAVIKKMNEISIQKYSDIHNPQNILSMLSVLTEFKKLEPQIVKSNSRYTHPLLVRNKQHGVLSAEKVSLSDLQLTANFQIAMAGISSDEFTIEFQFQYLDKRPNLFLTKLTLLCSDKMLAELILDSSTMSISSLASSLLPNIDQLKEYRQSLTKKISFNAPVFNIFDNDSSDDSDHQISFYLRRLFQDALQNLALCFSPRRLSHVSPVRAYPKRYYVSGQNRSEQLDGENYLEAMWNDEELCTRANRWLSNFGISVKVQRLSEVLHRAAIEQEGTELDLDIKDVGFGVSQVLPVLIQAFLVPNMGLCLIEQPEIHLHPKMQAELIDFFIDVIVTSQKRDRATQRPCMFLIETHSEALLRRLRTRLSERIGINEENMVAIYGVERGKEGVSRVKRIEIDSSGEFPWPQDFLDTELCDNLAFLQNISGGK